MRQQGSISFANQNFQLLLKLIVILVLLILLLFFFIPSISTSGGIGVVASLLFMLLTYPKKIIIENDKLIYRFIPLRKDRVINIADIQTLDFSKSQKVVLSYMPAGFTSPSYEQIRLKKSDHDLFRTSLISINPGIEVD